jgi:hypothetical protein
MFLITKVTNTAVKTNDKYTTKLPNSSSINISRLVRESRTSFENKIKSVEWTRYNPIVFLPIFVRGWIGLFISFIATETPKTVANPFARNLEVVSAIPTGA